MTMLVGTGGKSGGELKLATVDMSCVQDTRAFRKPKARLPSRSKKNAEQLPIRRQHDRLGKVVAAAGLLRRRSTRRPRRRCSWY